MMKALVWVSLNLWTLPAMSSAYRIALVPKMKDEFFDLVSSGWSHGGDVIDNVTCLYNGTLEADVEGSIEILNELIDDDSVDGITVSVLDPEAYGPVINRAIAKGKPIITVDSDAPLSHRLAYVGTDNYAMGRELAKLLKQVKPDGGRYGIVSGFGDADNLNERVRGVRDVLAPTMWKEVDDSPKNGREESYNSLLKMYELVEENPGLEAIVSVVGLVSYLLFEKQYVKFSLLITHTELFYL